MGYDPYSYYSVEKLYQSFIHEIETMCIRHRGSSFSFISRNNFSFFEKYQLKKHLFGKVWVRDGQTAGIQAYPLCSKIEAVARKLPRGISLKILTETFDGRQGVSDFIGDRFEIRVTYTIKIDVSSTYASRFFESICTGSIIHDRKLDRLFMRDAKRFYTKLQEQHSETMKKIATIVKDECHRYGYYGYNLYVYPDKIYMPIGERDIYFFRTHGMAALPSKQAVYGMTMLLMDLLLDQEGEQELYTFTQCECFVAVEQVDNPPPVLTEW